MNTQVVILDTTLRDGSYVVDFQFTAKDTAIIAGQLDQAGVPYIEIGHGLGLGASNEDDMKAAESDENYLLAASSSIKNSKWGCFFIPGIGTITDIEKAAETGMSFIRIGTDVNSVEKSSTYIKRAKKLGLEVFSNLMKSYAVPAESVAKNARIAEQFGTDHVCVVDSAGGMFPRTVGEYVDAVVQAVDVPVGFHGHNNLGLAIANGIAAIEHGATVIDTSVRGMGRSAGNAVTEIFVLALKRLGIELGIDVNVILKIAENYIDPMTHSYRPTDSLGVISGYAQFHSSFLGKVMKYSEQHRVDPRELIVALTAVDQVNAPDDLLNQLAIEIKNNQSDLGMERTWSVQLPSSSNDLLDGEIQTDAAKIAKRCSSYAKKLRIRSVLNLVQSVRPNTLSHISSVLYEGSAFIICSAEVNSVQDAQVVIEKFSGVVDFILLDIDDKNTWSSELVSCIDGKDFGESVLTYSDLEVWARTTIRCVRNIIREYKMNQIVIVGKNDLSDYVYSMVSIIRNEVNVSRLSSIDAYTYSGRAAIVLCSDSSNFVFPHVENCVVIDAYINAMAKEQIRKVLHDGNRVHRIEMHAEIHAEIQNSLLAQVRLKESNRKFNIDGLDMISGGTVGIEGSIVVDSTSNPTRVIGIADGCGRIKLDKDLLHAERVLFDKANRLIIEHRYL
jgi:4-hydroxy 2-oxovalerate aldolase